MSWYTYFWYALFWQQHHQHVYQKKKNYAKTMSRKMFSAYQNWHIVMVLTTVEMGRMKKIVSLRQVCMSNQSQKKIYL